MVVLSFSYMWMGYLCYVRLIISEIKLCHECKRIIRIYGDEWKLFDEQI
jgi:hypothetical protein